MHSRGRGPAGGRPARARGRPRRSARTSSRSIACPARPAPRHRFARVVDSRVPAVGARHNPTQGDTSMKIVRFSQNGHAPRLGCFLGSDRIADLEASAAAFLAVPRRGARARHRGGPLSARQHARLPRGRQREPGHADRHDGGGARRQVRAGGPLAVLGAAARADRGPGQVHLHRPQLQGPRGRDEQPGAQAAAGVPQVGQRDPGSGRAGPAAARREDARLGGRARAW